MGSFEHANKKKLEDYWQKRWETEDTPWHRDRVDDILVKYFNKCYPDKPPRRAFLPLCGKSKDLLWLAERDCEVIGVEINRKVCEDFYNENGIDHVLLSSGNIPVFKGVDFPITIYNCNIFDAPISEMGKCDFIWDRGSIIAVTGDTRAAYYSLVKKLFDDTFHYLIEACIYDESEFSDFPMSITLEQLAKLVGEENLKLEMLEEEDTTEISRVKFGCSFTYFKCVTYLISNK